MEQLAINCKFLYVSIISTNNSKCRFFTVYEVQLTLMYYLYVLLLPVCILCVLHVFYF